MPRFAAVVCEDIERSARDMLSALRLEKQLSAQGIPLFATDEPADIAGMNATTVLVRRVKQGVAEWYRIQLKEKVWKGLVEHSMDGWNIGPAPLRVRRRPASRTPTRSRPPRAAPRPGSSSTPPPPRRGSDLHLADRGQAGAADHRRPAERQPRPSTRRPAGSDGWAASSVDAILRNPKYTGHRCSAVTATGAGERVKADPAEWLWTPAPVHPAIIDRATWEAAQGIGAEHGTSRDRDPAAPPASAPYYLYRSRVRCKTCTAADDRHRQRTRPRVRLLPVPAPARQPPPHRRRPRPPPHRAGPRTPPRRHGREVLLRPHLRPRPRRVPRRAAARHRRRSRRPPGHRSRRAAAPPSRSWTPSRTRRSGALE